MIIVFNVQECTIVMLGFEDKNKPLWRYLLTRLGGNIRPNLRMPGVTHALVGVEPLEAEFKEEVIIG